MKWSDREQVTQSVAIGRRVLRRRVNGVIQEQLSSLYTAEYTDASGRRRFESLETSVKKDARMKALAIQQRLDGGVEQHRPARISMSDLMARFESHCVNKDLVPKSLAKYRAEGNKLMQFCSETGVKQAAAFGEDQYHHYGAWLRGRRHKQGVVYAGKTIYTSLTFVKSLLKYGWRQKLLQVYPLDHIALPSSRARPQPCFTYDQVQTVLTKTEGITHAAVAILFYTGMRVGECVQLQHDAIHRDAGELGKIHIFRGGSADTPKDKDHRWIPIDPRLHDLLKGLPKASRYVLPGLKARTLLSHLKRVCRELGYDPRLKVHSLRHAACSYWLANGIPMSTCLEWLGHGSSEMLSHYLHVHDRDSERAMKLVAERTANLR